MTKYYTTSAVAKLCNVHRNTIIGAIRKGLLRIHRTPGGHARISQEDLDDFCHRRSLPTTSLISRNNRILLVDDSGRQLGVMAQGLRDAGYLVEIASNPFDVGYQFASFAPNVVVASIGAGGELGEEVCRNIRRMPRNRTVPVIGLIQVKEGDALPDVSVDDILPRPVDVDSLILRVVRLIGPIVSGTSGRASTEITRRVMREDFDEDMATRKAVRRNPNRTTENGVLSGPDLEAEFVDESD